jgi:hypothetical protein
MLSVSHRTGPFDTLVTLEPATSARIAAWAGLNERYVREWLGVMVTARIVEYDPATTRRAVVGAAVGRRDVSLCRSGRCGRPA